MKRIICVILALVICMSVLCSCGKKETSGKNFAAAVTSLPATFDPQIAASDSEKTIALNCFDTLMRPDESGKMQCLAAESYTVSDDGLVYTFKIRDGLKYFTPTKTKKFIEEKGGQIPQNVTAYDFAFGIIRGIFPETQAADYSLLANIKNAEAVHNGEADKTELGVVASDERTLVITLQKADANFLFSLSQAISAPCNEQFFNLTGGRYGLEQKYSIFSGAFYVSGVSEEKSVTISKNSEYKGENAAVPNAVTFYLNEDLAQVASKIKKGNYDCAFLDSTSAKSVGGKATATNLTNITYSLVFNFAQERFSSVNLRKGLILAIDFSTLSDINADGIVAPDYILSGKKASNSGVRSAQFNVNGARQYLTNALEELDVSTVDINIICTKENEQLAKNIINSWQKHVGVELNGNVSVLEKNDFDAAIGKKEFDIAIYPVSVSSSDAKALMSVFSSDSKDNFIGYTSEEYDRILADLTESPTQDNLSYAQSFLIENAVVTPLYFDSQYFVCAEGVSGIYFVQDTSNIYFCNGRKQ